MKRWFVEKQDYPNDKARPFVVRRDSVRSSARFHFETEEQAIARAEQLNRATLTEAQQRLTVSS